MNDPALDELLGPAGRRRRWWRRPGPWVALALALGAAAAGWAWYGQRQAAAAPRYEPEAVQRGALTVTVVANGSLQPTTQVAIGSELSGTVSSVLVDVNDRVKSGQVLVELDTARLRDQVVGSRAALAAAQSGVQQAQANQREAQGVLERLRDVQRRSGGQVPSKNEMAAAEAAQARAEATLASAIASVAQARATLNSNETNLAKASIRSPIDGVVLSRSVEPGNAVAASLQAVTLFTLGGDLRQMKLEVNVDEADVGQVRAGQQASFTVAAFPTRRFPAQIKRVGVGPTTRDNVVTYLTELSVDNADLSLRPGMSATATITTLQRDDALLVPNAALRFSPEQAGAAAPGFASRMFSRPGGANARRAGTDTSLVREVWVLQDGAPRAVPVTPGFSDGRVTEVSDTPLQAGTELIVAQLSGAAP